MYNLSCVCLLTWPPAKQATIRRQGAVPEGTDARVFTVERCQHQWPRLAERCAGLASVRSARRLSAASPCDAAAMNERKPNSLLLLKMYLFKVTLHTKVLQGHFAQLLQR